MASWLQPILIMSPLKPQRHKWQKCDFEIILAVSWWKPILLCQAAVFDCKLFRYFHRNIVFWKAIMIMEGTDFVFALLKIDKITYSWMCFYRRYETNAFRSQKYTCWCRDSNSGPPRYKLDPSDLTTEHGRTWLSVAIKHLSWTRFLLKLLVLLEIKFKINLY